ncbi:predicted protein [Sclerotinia sclerotiorum 1980 UF-70]|uniref:Uncharacterized protein n=1 Tax=Sclerotinia sclerotiorum (strain ATCC 18683 / 1980 / Ss-1) TaxID=665079 RepID=A7ECB7_SCLS1|nr:predicted protein [Sclerotinia sclerotiorum 1980 UF-70]EDO00096.1 predicted protein [Sclerotinia sclerotiorum 1980 UF-70]
MEKRTWDNHLLNKCIKLPIVEDVAFRVIQFNLHIFREEPHQKFTFKPVQALEVDI